VREWDKDGVVCRTDLGQRTTMTRAEWYAALAKPSWMPDGGTIGLIWSLLYPVIAITFEYVFVQAVRRKVPRAVALPFAVNVVANLIFTPIQFGLRNLPLAAVDILVMLGSIV
jgi:translocator protein